MNKINDDVVVKTGVKNGYLWTGTDFRSIGINCPSLAIEFLKTKKIYKGNLLWEHKDDDLARSTPEGKVALALYKFPK